MQGGDEWHGGVGHVGTGGGRTAISFRKFSSLVFTSLNMMLEYRFSSLLNQKPIHLVYFTATSGLFSMNFSKSAALKLQKVAVLDNTIAYSSSLDSIRSSEPNRSPTFRISLTISLPSTSILTIFRLPFLRVKTLPLFSSEKKMMSPFRTVL